MSLPVGRITYTITIFFTLLFSRVLFSCEFFFLTPSGAIQFSLLWGGGGMKTFERKRGTMGRCLRSLRARLYQNFWTLDFECCLAQIIPAKIEIFSMLL